MSCRDRGILAGSHWAGFSVGADPGVSPLRVGFWWPQAGPERRGVEPYLYRLLATDYSPVSGRGFASGVFIKAGNGLAAMILPAAISRMAMTISLLSPFTNTGAPR